MSTISRPRALTCVLYVYTHRTICLGTRRRLSMAEQLRKTEALPGADKRLIYTHHVTGTHETRARAHGAGEQSSRQRASAGGSINDPTTCRLSRHFLSPVYTRATVLSISSHPARVRTQIGDGISGRGARSLDRVTAGYRNSCYM